MVLFAAVLQLASVVMWVLVAAQFLFSLITGEDNQHLRRFGHSLSTYIYDVLKFLCYSSEEKPFPFADWPTVKQDVPDKPETATAAVQEPPKSLSDTPDQAAE